MARITAGNWDFGEYIKWVNENCECTICQGCLVGTVLNQIVMYVKKLVFYSFLTEDCEESPLKIRDKCAYKSILSFHILGKGITNYDSYHR